jgi:carbon-monoxide dehydrogenase large subunit
MQPLESRNSATLRRSFNNRFYKNDRRHKNAAWTTTFQDYLLPTAPDVPSCRIEHVETPNPLNPLGVKGAGEGGTIPAPAAIIAAIEDALSPFAVRFVEMPLTPDRIVEVLRDAGAYDKLAAA